MNQAIDFQEVERLIAQGYLTKRKHPTEPLWILNYTAKCQYEPYWTPETRACRGLVVDAENRIVARGFPKFHNHDEMERYPELQAVLERHLRDGDPVEVTEKLDGSLILMFTYNEQTIIATRGSFESPQALKAREILANKYPQCGFPEGGSYLFEVVYPANRIVVNYGDTEDLYHLAAFNGPTGEERPLIHTAFPRPLRYAFDSFADVINYEQQSRGEGFVIHFPKSGLRVKLKWAEYKRLHRLITGVTPRHIWEELAAGRSLDALLEQVPDEWYQWAKQVQTGLEDRYAEVFRDAENCLSYAMRQGYRERKEFAEYFKGCRYPAVCFKLLDGRPPDEIIWKQIKPEAAAAFRCDEP